MIGERNITATAAESKTTVPALDIVSPAPPINKQNRLLAISQHLIYHLRKGLAERAPVTRLKLIPHIHHLNFRQRRTGFRDNPLRKFKSMKLPPLRPVIGFHSRGSAAQDNHRIG